MSAAPVPTKAVRLTVAIIGGAGVGKTNISNVFRGNKFTTKWKTTVESDCKLKEICFQGEKYELNLWDTANVGGSNPKTVFLSCASAIVAVYDITKQKSLEKTVKHIQNAMSMRNAEQASKVALVLVGNKKDLAHERQITMEKGQEMAGQLGASFVECSALDNFNINNIFQLLMKERFTKLGKQIVWWKK